MPYHPPNNDGSLSGAMQGIMDPFGDYALNQRPLGYPGSNMGYFPPGSGGGTINPGNNPNFGLGYTPGMPVDSQNSRGAIFQGFMNGRPVFRPQAVGGGYGERQGGGAGPGAFGNGYFMGGLQSGGSGAMQRFIAMHRSY